MLKNISVSTKGFAAFAILAFIAIGASSLMYMRALTAHELVQNSQTMGELLTETASLTTEVNKSNLHVKNFLLTGNREFVKAYEETSATIDAQFSKLKGLYAEHAANEEPVLNEAATVLGEWRSTVVDRQIKLMRDPMTVELARVLELTGEGSRLLGEFSGKVGGLVGTFQQKSAAASSNQMSALTAVEFISLAASIIVALVAAGMGLMNFQMVSRPLSRLADATAKLANGDLDVTIEKGGKDEIGKMAEAMQVFREAGIANQRHQDTQRLRRQVRCRPPIHRGAPLSVRRRDLTPSLAAATLRSVGRPKCDGASVGRPGSGPRRCESRATTRPL